MSAYLASRTTIILLLQSDHRHVCFSCCVSGRSAGGCDDAEAGGALSLLGVESPVRAGSTEDAEPNDIACCREKLRREVHHPDIVAVIFKPVATKNIAPCTALSLNLEVGEGATL